MATKALVSADRPVVRIWHPDDPKQYVELLEEPWRPPGRMLNGSAGRR